MGRRAPRRALGALLPIALVGCGGAHAGASSAAAVPSRAVARSADVRASAEVLATIDFPDGEPASLFWHDAASTLYIADNENNQLWSWTEADGLRRFATTADPTGALAADNATNVGQIAQLLDGTLLVVRFGEPGGGFSGVSHVDPRSKTSAWVPHLDEHRKRLGIGVAQDGRIFGSYFKAHAGDSAVTRLDLQAGEVDFALGFRKVTGLLAVGATLYVADQQADAIYALPLEGSLPAPGQYTVFASLPRPDQLCAGPDGSLFAGQFSAARDASEPVAVRQIMADGSVRIAASARDFSRPNAVAYDAAERRLFVANGGKLQRFIRIFRVP